VTASLIRSLENLLHDASHGNVLPSRRGNRLLAQTLLAPILLDDLDAYRRAHLGHHFFLGSRRDPELLRVPRPRPGDTPWRAIRRVYLPTVLSWAFLRSSLAGRLPTLPGAARLRCLAWWTTGLAGLGLLGGPAFALGCAGFWFGTRITAYHLLKAFTEICDHALLDTDSILSFTRTMPARGVLRAFLHPNNDNYHLAHHLFPGVPMCNLGRLHEVLLELPEYAASRRYEAYFLGPGSVFASWGGPPEERWAVEAAGAARGPVAAGKEAR
jgi:fatty acid desaturase